MCNHFHYLWKLKNKRSSIANVLFADPVFDELVITITLTIALTRSLLSGILILYLTKKKKKMNTIDIMIKAGYFSVQTYSPAKYMASKMDWFYCLWCIHSAHSDAALREKIWISFCTVFRQIWILNGMDQEWDISIKYKMSIVSIIL